jgi:hypothetical protein
LKVFTNCYCIPRQSLFLVLVLSASVALADQGYGYAPKFYCRDTNTSIYAEVCVPGIDTATKPVELNIKNVVDDKYCYTQTSTKCEEQTKPIEREVCTYTYSSKAEKMPATFIQVRPKCSVIECILGYSTNSYQSFQ